MSMSNDSKNDQAYLPENPVELILNVISEPQIVQVTHEETLVANEDAAQTLATRSINADHDAQAHTSQQLINENQASNHAAGAENAANETVYHSNTSAAEHHDIEAQTHNVLAHSAATESAEDHAKSASLEQISKIQRTAQEETQRITFAVQEIENRTAEAIKQDMKTAGAIADTDTSHATHDLESKLAASAQLASPS